MKKTHAIFAALVALAVAGSATSCRRNSGYPMSPTAGQEYYDESGNRSVWNSAGYWMIYSSMNGRPSGVTHYYPSSGTYRNSANHVITRPSSVPAFRTAAPTRSSMFSGSHSTGSSSRSGGFGSSGHSFGGGHGFGG
jgi:uncharacterized membrane protein YgcG